MFDVLRRLATPHLGTDTTIPSTITAHHRTTRGTDSTAGAAPVTAPRVDPPSTVVSPQAPNRIRVKSSIGLGAEVEAAAVTASPPPPRPPVILVVEVEAIAAAVVAINAVHITTIMAMGTCRAIEVPRAGSRMQAVSVRLVTPSVDTIRTGGLVTVANLVHANHRLRPINEALI